MALVGTILSGCAASPLFPPEVLERVDQTITFASLKSNPSQYQGKTIELGGQILESKPDQEEFQLLVRELPVRTDPVYGPAETGQYRGMFVVRYRGKLTYQDTQHGNLVLVIGTVLGAVTDTLTGAPVARPTLQAECLHIWRTQGQQLDDFPWLPNTRYWPLVHQTFCVNTPSTLLYLSRLAYHSREAA